MTIAALCEKLSLAPLPQEVILVRDSELLSSVSAAFEPLWKAIEDSSVTIEQIDAFLESGQEILASSKDQDAKAFLLSRKAWLLLGQGRAEEGLSCYDQALNVKEMPSTWALKGSALLQTDRLDEAFDAFRRSYALKEGFGPQKQAYLEDLLAGWSVSALLRCLAGILEQDIREAEKGAFEYIALLKQAKEDGLEQMVLNLAVEKPVPEEIKAGLEELALMVRLLSIEDPFEGWRELGKEMSKVWPKGLSAVDAIREQRDREWNR